MSLGLVTTQHDLGLSVPRGSRGFAPSKRSGVHDEGRGRRFPCYLIKLSRSGQRTNRFDQPGEV